VEEQGQRLLNLSIHAENPELASKRQEMEQNLTNAARQDSHVSQVLSAATGISETEDEILSHAFLTIEEAALLLRVSKRTVYNLIYKGVLRATKVSYHVTVISKQDFLEMLERNRYVGTVAFPKTTGRN